LKSLKKVEHSIVEMVSLKRGFVFWGFLTTMFLGSLLTWLTFGKIVTSPNHYFVGNTPSATSTYFTTAWHLQNDTTWVSYSGMNYPFGEHIGYAINQPFISELALSWHQHVTDLSSATAGLINLSNLFFILFGAGALFLLLSKLHLPAWYAIPCALAITFLSPPTSAFPTFTDWAHPFFIPMLLYWLCRYEERTSRRYQSLHIALLLTASSMLQPAYFGVSALFLTVFTGFQLLRKPSKSNILRRLSHWSVMTLIPMVALNIWIHWENFAADRPAAADPNGIQFISLKNVLLPWANPSSGSLPAYAGLLATIYLVAILLSGLRMFGKSWSAAAYHRVHFQYLRGIFLASITLLIPAIGFPGVEHSIAYLRIKDTAPLSWFFYYVVNILAIYGAWNWGKRIENTGEKKGAPILRFGILALPLAVLITEAIYHQSTTPELPISPNLTVKEVAVQQGMSWLDSLQFEQFQAVLPLPYYHVGSSNWEILPDSALFNESCATALHTGLPNMGVFMKQTSLHQTLLSLQLVGTPGEMPSILSNLPNRRPLAILVPQSSWEAVQYKYAHLTQHSTPIYKDSQLIILKLEIDTLKNNIKRQHHLIAKALSQASITQNNTRWTAATSVPFFYAASFDEGSNTKTSFQGTGAYQGYTSDSTQLWSGSAPPGNYFLNCWIKLDKENGSDQRVFFTETSPTSSISSTQTFQLKEHLTSIVKGWGCFEIPLTFQENKNYRLFLHQQGNGSPFFLDEVLIRPSNIALFRKEQGWMVQNNYWYREISR
jgi:hypothetical protein